MIERLVHSLQLLALPAEARRVRSLDPAAATRALALDFDDALRLVSDCPQMELTDAQHAALGAVDALLSRMSDETSDETSDVAGGEEQASLWTEQAIRDAPEWEAVRHAAARALGALGQAPAAPGGDAPYIPGAP